MKITVKIYQTHTFKKHTYLGETQVSWIPRQNDSIIFKNKEYMVVQADLNIDTDETKIYVE